MLGSCINDPAVELEDGILSTLHTLRQQSDIGIQTNADQRAGLRPSVSIFMPKTILTESSSSVSSKLTLMISSLEVGTFLPT
jgi:hypothetical protein